MEKMVNVYFYGKRYSVPESLTVIAAWEYAGYTLKRGVGCNMYIASIPFYPQDKRIYNINDLKVSDNVMMELYPEIYSCIGCNACTKACPQSLNVMQYIAYAQRGEFEKCAEESFDCVMCGCCSTRCPAGISHPYVGLLARRLTGKYIAPKSQHLEKRVEEIAEGKFDEPMKEMASLPTEKLEELYNNREIEK